MPARSLEQALEGVPFPCDRARLLDYARNNNIAAPALARLQDIPPRQYSDLSEVFSALSGEAEAEPAGSGREDVWWQANWRLGAAPLEVTVHCLRTAADTWPHWYRLGLRLWFPWMK